MVEEIVDTLTTRFNKNNLALELPDAFDHLKGSDASIEMSVSNTLQPLNLFFGDNLVTDSISYIFVNTECKDL